MATRTYRTVRGFLANHAATCDVCSQPVRWETAAADAVPIRDRRDGHVIAARHVDCDEIARDAREG